MAKLTEGEHRAMIDGRGTREDEASALAKLDQLQQAYSDPEYVAAINRLIPVAWEYANRIQKEEGTTNKERDRIYYLKMNWLAREEGLRK